MSLRHGETGSIKNTESYKEQKEAARKLRKRGKTNCKREKKGV